MPAISAPDLTHAGLSAQFADALSAADIAGWHELHARALEPNAFYAPGYTRAAMAHLPEGGRTRLLTVRRDGRLVGLLPLVREPKRYLLPLPMLKAAEYYVTLSTPLLDAERPDETWSAMLDALAEAGVRAILLGFAIESGPAFAALQATCARTHRPIEVIGRHERALLSSPETGATYLRTALETRRRKEADRQRRRLAELGEVSFHVARSAAEAAPALEAYFDLEAAGWKGRSGTDMRSVPGQAAFVRQAVLDMTAAGTARVVSLMCGARHAAVGIVLTSGSRAFYAKTTYDESLARFSPGLLLTLDLTAHLLDDPDIADADSIAIADHPMIDRVWTARLPVRAVMVACRPGGGAVFRLIAVLERLRERVRTSSAGIRRRFRTSGQ